ncbi:MAG: BMP family ABC transporter substrate-binding protein [Oscillospiraceae bacterium]|nr:BMP family ABC transporter substrate-binding protein [Oscillospiraceae bacterium]
MKKIVITLVIIITAIIGGVFFVNTYESETDVTKTVTRVGVILNGFKDDKSWSQSHYEGLEETARQLNLDITYKEYVTTDTVYHVIDEFAEEGCRIIIANSAVYDEHIVKAAQKHPEIFFFHATGTTQGKNLSTYFGRMYQMRYLTGIVAGLQTQTNEIGYAAAFPIPEVNRGINAFTLGVRSVNPDAKVYVKWINSWKADMEAEKAAASLIENHNIDVLAMHTDSIEPLRVADEHGIMSIGYNVDNSALYPDSCLTSAVWNWEKFYTPHILKCLQGKFEGINYWESSDTGIMDIAPLSDNAKDGIADIIEAEKQRLNSGTFDVFYGPIYDNEGNLRIAEGESMTDSAMLNDFDWYVEGVVIDE